MEMKQMAYQNERKLEILAKGEYKGVAFAILNLGTHPTAYVENIVNVADYDDKKIENVIVHWGFTFCDKAHWDKEDKKSYLGWDYAHCDDWRGYYTDKDYYFLENNKKWTTEEIYEEVKSVIEQLLELKGE